MNSDLNEPQSSESPPSVDSPQKIVDSSKDQSTSNDETDLRQILPKEVAQMLPPSARQSVEMMMQMTGPMPNPVTKKITAEHISRIIEVTEASEIRQHEDGKDSRRWLFAFSCLGVGAFLFLVVFLADRNKDLLLELLKLFVTFVGGIGAGWGIKAYKDKSTE